MVVFQRPFLLLVFAVLWMLLQDSYRLDNFVAGLIIGAIMLLIFPTPEHRLVNPKVKGPGGFFRWVGKAVHLGLYFLWELLLANWAVAKLVLKPNLKLTPGILAMKLRIRQPGQIALLANLITLTPGTISTDVSKNNDILYIHCIDASDPEGALASCRRFEELVMEVLQ